MSKAKMPEKRAAGGANGAAKGKAKAKDGKKKKIRGPKSHLEPNRRKVDDEMIQGAEEMVGEGSGHDSDEDVVNGAGKGADFLLHLDERSVSK
jgi:hypothetical protein